MLAGILAGTLTTVGWYFVPALKSRMYELVPAFVVGLAATVLVSLLARPPGAAESLMADVRTGRDRTTTTVYG